MILRCRMELYDGRLLQFWQVKPVNTVILSGVVNDGLSCTRTNIDIITTPGWANSPNK